MDKLTMQLIENELERADAKHGTTVFDFHHGYAIVKEEVEEVNDCVESMNRSLNDIWQDIKLDSMDGVILVKLEILEAVGNELLTEVVQVMAMCEKIKRELIK